MRYKQFSLLILSFTLCTATLRAQQGAIPGNEQVSGTLTLRQAVDIAIKNNLVVNQADINSQSYKIAYDQSWEYMLPTLSASGGQGLNFGRSISSANNQYVNTQYESGSASLNAGLPLFRGLQLQNGRKAALFAYEASKKDLQTQKDNITLNVLNAYLAVLNNRDQLALALEQAQADSVQVARLELMNSQGAVSPMNTLTDLRGQYASDQVNISIATQTLETSKVFLFSILNIPYNRDVQYENTVTTTDISAYPAASDSVFRTALGIIPGIQSAQLKVHQYERALAQARGAYYPTISLSASVGTNWTNTPAGTSNAIDSGYSQRKGIYALGGGAQLPIYEYGYTYGPTTYPKWWDQFKNNRGEFIGINVNIPILNGFQARNNVRNAKLNLETAQINNANVRNVLQQNVETAFQNMVAAYKNYKFYMDQAKAYEESFRIQNIRFTEGVITSDVYIQAKARNDIAEVNLAAAKYIYIFRTKVLDYYQGRLAIP
jgi:outer membrane protein